jgi:hypothetical protein
MEISQACLRSRAKTFDNIYRAVRKTVDNKPILTVENVYTFFVDLPANPQDCH